MAPPIRTSREDWLRAGLQALASGGPEAVRVEAVATNLKVTKGGFYGHFADRRAFLNELLDSWERRMVDRVIDTIESGGGDGRERLMRLYEMASAVGELFRVELAVRDWARRDPEVAARLRRVDNRRMDYMRALFSEFCSDPAEVEARCLTAFALFTGIPLIAAEFRGGRRAEVIARAGRRLLD